MKIPDFTKIKEAATRIQSYAHKTPVLTSSFLNNKTKSNLYFKCENFQKVGAFKFRGACNAVLSLSDEQAQKGVITHSSGNHAQALSLAAGMRSIKATVIMPSNAPQVKVDAVKGYGGQVVFCPPTLKDREQTTQKIIEKTGAYLVHSYNDERIICGQGTAALELLTEHNDLDIILVPLGGGGLTSGTLISTNALSPHTKVYGVEPEGADDAMRSLKAGKIIPSISPKTIADGLLTSLGELTFAVIQHYIADIITVSDRAIMTAMQLIWERMKIVVEPSAAVTLAALLENKVDSQGKKIGLMLSGGNRNFE